jgi:hypothetical protein
LKLLDVDPDEFMAASLAARVGEGKDKEAVLRRKRMMPKPLLGFESLPLRH